MTRIELAPDIIKDFDRILEHMNQYEVTGAASRIEDILQAVSVLEHNPLIGRPVRADLRELLIGRQSRGYVASYHYIPEIDTVFVLAIRSQREAGYDRTEV
jgi:plasmid stabilization system protein ParE